MTDWYVSREAVKKAVGINGSDKNSLIDSYIEAASREVDRLTSRRFIPKTELRNFDWPQRHGRRVYVIYLDEDLLAATALTKEGDDATAIAAADYFLEPDGVGPPYSRIEIDLASKEYFLAKDTHQRQIRVTGRWGYSEDTKSAGTVASGLAADATATTFVCSDGSLIDIGDSLLIETEQLFVNERANAQVGTQQLNMPGNLAADISVVAVTVDDGTKFFAGEIILVDSERMYIESISGNVLTVIRAYDGSVLASHNDNAAVHAFRTLTITRGVNGTTGATHADATAINKYVPPPDITNLARALALAYYEGGQSGWTGVIGGAESAIETRMTALDRLRKQIRGQYGRRLIGAV